MLDFFEPGGGDLSEREHSAHHTLQAVLLLSLLVGQVPPPAPKLLGSQG